jgi:hypothetical protein
VQEFDALGSGSEEEKERETEDGNGGGDGGAGGSGRWSLRAAKRGRAGSEGDEDCGAASAPPKRPASLLAVSGGASETHRLTRGALQPAVGRALLAATLQRAALPAGLRAALARPGTFTQAPPLPAAAQLARSGVSAVAPAGGRLSDLLREALPAPPALLPVPQVDAALRAARGAEGGGGGGSSSRGGGSSSCCGGGGGSGGGGGGGGGGLGANGARTTAGGGPLPLPSPAERPAPLPAPPLPEAPSLSPAVPRSELEAIVSDAVRPFGREAREAESVEAFKAAGKLLFGEARARAEAGVLRNAEEARAWAERRARELLRRK